MGKSSGTYKDRYPKKCTHLCPSCKRVCELTDEHQGMHRCGLHEWVYGYRNTITIVIFTNGLEHDSKN